MGLQVAWAVFTILIPLVKAHPQCLDFRPPFGVENGLDFCSQYQDFGCCSRRNDSAVKQQYDNILRQVDRDTADRCRNYLKSILCLECDPYAAHLFNFEETLQKSPFPGLCGRYCSDFYRNCRILIPFISADPGIVSAAENGEQAFCNLAKVVDLDYCYPDLLTNPALNGELETSRSSSEGCLCLEPFADQLRNPILFLTIPGDPDQRIFIAEQLGLVHIYFKNRTRLREPFLDLSNIVLTSSFQGDERGFLGMAFHPNYLSNGEVYVYFSLRSNNRHATRISRFLVSSQNQNKVDRNSQKIILEQDQPYSNHNGGALFFGLDGYLYLFMGDGGAGGDPQDFAQNLNSWLGKALRIDVNVPRGSSQPYLVPPDNPFLNRPDAKPEIYAYGIRNIWRCDMDEGDPETGADAGRIICGDVGQNRLEEIDIIKSGGNYGWKTREGNRCFNNDRRCGRLTDEVLPIYDYPHSVGKSVTGGHVYRGCLNPSLQGQYIYGDYVSGRLFKLIENKASGQWTNREINMCNRDLCFNGLVGNYDRSILSFGEDEDGEIYMLTTNSASPTNPRGTIFKFVDPRKRGDPAKCRSNKVRQGVIPTRIPAPSRTPVPVPPVPVPPVPVPPVLVPPVPVPPVLVPSNNNNCGRGWTYSQSAGLCYRMTSQFPSGLRWSDAKQLCEGMGGQLASPKTQEQHSAIVDVISSANAYDRNVWIGMYHQSGSYSSNINERRRGWQWVDGSMVEERSWGAWNGGEPGLGELWVRVRYGRWLAIGVETDGVYAMCQKRS